MTYKDVLDDLINILDRHYMIVTWGYGNLSDLVTPFKKQDVTTGSEVYNIDYPYAFLQPTGHQLSTGKSTFNFNLIMMEQCEDSPNAVIQAQSNAYQYIKDCLAEIYYNYDQKFDFTLNSSVIPFKEKYDDTVSGMTATISIEIPTILDDCIAPFAPRTELNIWANQLTPQTVGTDVGEQLNIAYANEIVNVDNTWSVNRMATTVEAVYSFETTYSFQFETPDAGETYPDPPRVREIGGASFVEATTTTGWPETPEPGVTYNIKQTWAARTVPAGTLSFVYMQDTAGPQTEMLLEAGAELKVYKQA